MERRGDQSDEHVRSLRDASLLGYRLSQARGFRVVNDKGDELGVLERMRYERHSDRPDEIIVRTGLIRRRRAVLPFESVLSVDVGRGVVQVRAGGPARVQHSTTPPPRPPPSSSAS